MNLWSRLGVSVALAACFCILMLEVFQDKDYYEQYKWHSCAVLLTLGAGLWITGRIIRRRAAANAPVPKPAPLPGDSDLEEEVSGLPFFIANLSYFGTMLLVFGIIVTLIVPMKKVVKIEKAAARKFERPPVVQEPPAEEPPPPPATVEVKLPTLKLQGIVFRHPNPSVLLNNHTYFVGDLIENGKLVDITPTNATVEFEQQRVVLNLEE